MKSHTLLVTGAAGFIGSHTVLELVSAGFNVVGIDNFCNSRPDILERLQKIKSEVLHIEDRFIKIHDLDVRNEPALKQLFLENKIAGVIHFAGLKAVGESITLPLDYWSNNVGGTMNLLRVMNEQGVKNLVFSSSATVYGVAAQLPALESAPTHALNPYGRTKLVCEQILSDFSRANPDWNISLLRYFNPVGAHPCGLIGELPNGVPNNLMPFVTQVAAGLREQLLIFGRDYDTPDGTCIRDYIHVVDLAKAHVSALEAMFSRNEHGISGNDRSHSKFSVRGLQIFNLGTGQGVSVKAMVDTFERVNGVKVNHEYAARREGDVPVLYANVDKANLMLGWRAEKTLENMCEDAWRWQCNLKTL